MANQTITQLPDAGPITGSELVPVVQNGGTYKTTASALAGSPVQTQTFLTLNNEPTLNNSRYLSASTGVGLTDGGAQSYLRISLNGASGSLESASTGIVAKTASSTVTARTLSVSGSGLTVSNGNGVSGNPTFALTGIAAAVANLGGTGLMAIVGGATVAGRQILGTSGEITVSNGNGSGNPTIGISDNAVLPGVEGVVLPSGTTDDRLDVVTNGTLRYNTDTETFEGYANNAWGSIAIGSGVTSVGLSMPSEFAVANSPVTSAGTFGVTWASETANYVFAAPNGSSGTPSFRAFVNADLPDSGVTANTYGSSTQVPVVTVNAKGIVTGVTTSTIIGTLNYQGGWNANTNTPTLASGTGTSGYYYVVTTAGTTDLDGITDWQVGDWAIFNGTAWQKVDQTNTVSSVNGYTGAVSLTYSDVGAPATDGTDATGTWNIDISGNAATATTASATAQTLTRGSYLTGSNFDGSAATTWAVDATDANTPSKVVVRDASGNFSAGTISAALSGNATSATNVAGGDANKIVYNTASGTTSFIDAPTTANYYLKWNGTSFEWNVAGTGTVTSVDVSGGTTGLTTSGGPVTSSGTITLAGTLATTNGGTGLTSFTAGDLPYYATGTALSKLGIGSSTYLLTSSGTAPQWSDPAGVTVGNASNVTTTATSTDADFFIPFVAASTTGNQSLGVDAGLSYNPSTNAMTSAINGGTF